MPYKHRHSISCKFQNTKKKSGAKKVPQWSRFGKQLLFAKRSHFSVKKGQKRYLKGVCSVDKNGASEEPFWLLFFLSEGMSNLGTSCHNSYTRFQLLLAYAWKSNCTLYYNTQRGILKPPALSETMTCCHPGEQQTHSTSKVYFNPGWQQVMKWHRFRQCWRIEASTLCDSQLHPKGRFGWADARQAFFLYDNYKDLFLHDMAVY